MYNIITVTICVRTCPTYYLTSVACGRFIIQLYTYIGYIYSVFEMFTKDVIILRTIIRLYKYCTYVISIPSLNCSRTALSYHEHRGRSIVRFPSSTQEIVVFIYFWIVQLEQSQTHGHTFRKEILYEMRPNSNCKLATPWNTQPMTSLFHHHCNIYWIFAFTGSHVLGRFNELLGVQLQWLW